MPQACQSCEKQGAPFKCPCKGAWYCEKACQQAAWATHKENCSYHLEGRLRKDFSPPTAMKLAEIYMGRHQYRESLPHLKRLEEFCDSCGDETSEMAHELHFNLSRVYHFCNMHDKSIALAQKRIPVARRVWGRGSQQMGDLIGTWVHALDCLGVDRWNEKDFVETWDDFKQHMDQTLLNCGLVNEVDSALRRGFYDLAEELMGTPEYRSLGVENRVRHGLRMASVLVDASGMDKDSVQFSKAVKHLEFVEQILAKNPGLRGSIKAEALALRGAVWHALGNSEKSQTCLRRAHKLYSEQGDGKQMNNTKNLSDYLKNLSDFLKHRSSYLDSRRDPS